MEKRRAHAECGEGERGCEVLVGRTCGGGRRGLRWERLLRQGAVRGLGMWLIGIVVMSFVANLWFVGKLYWSGGR